MRLISGVRSLLAAAAFLWPVYGYSQSQVLIGQAVFSAASTSAPEISTDQLRKLLDSGSAAILDVRSADEYALAHIPGSINIYEKELEQITRKYPDQGTQLVLYCNGPYCGKSKRLAEELTKLGYTQVRRYQLGLPVWRALGHVVQTDLGGARYVLAGDKTAVWVDARRSKAQMPIPGAVTIRKGEAEQANEDGRLPKRDKGTRVIVFADTPGEARLVAQEIARKAYWNSSYFSGPARDLLSAARP